MITLEEYEREHDPKKLSRIEVIIGLVFFASFMIYFFYNTIVCCWPILRTNLTFLLS